jgi:hypothetical protein
MDWEKATAYLSEVRKQYEAIIGMPQANPLVGLMFIDMAQRRLDSGERTQDLYDEIMSLE